MCSTQTKKFEESLVGLGDKIASYTVSLDLPFAQKRFCTTEGINNMLTLSDVHNHSFGHNYGVEIDSTTFATVAGNYIGTNASGTGAVPNAWWGVLLRNAASTVIGGTTAGAANVVKSGRGLQVTDDFRAAFDAFFHA